MPWNPQRISKDQARRLALDVKDTKRNVLLLPGLLCLDLKLGYQLGVFNKHTKCLLVENDPVTAQHIAELCGDKHTLLNKNLHEVQNELQTGIDLAYIDLCGAVTKPLHQWLPTFFAHTSNHADVAITMCLQKRGNTFLQELLHDFQDQDPTEYKRAYENLVIGESTSSWMAKVICAQLWSVYLALQHNGLLHHSTTFHPYQDSLGSGWMCLYRFSVSKPTQDLMKDATPGRKAAETRRINLRIQERVNDGKSATQVRAGYRSWETRRNNQTKTTEPREETTAQLARKYVEANDTDKIGIILQMAQHAEDKAKREGRSKTQIIAGFKSWVTRYA